MSTKHTITAEGWMVVFKLTTYMTCARDCSRFEYVHRHQARRSVDSPHRLSLFSKLMLQTMGRQPSQEKLRPRRFGSSSNALTSTSVRLSTLKKLFFCLSFRSSSFCRCTVPLPIRLPSTNPFLPFIYTHIIYTYTRTSFIDVV